MYIDCRSASLTANFIYDRKRGTCMKCAMQIKFEQKMKWQRITKDLKEEIELLKNELT